MFLGLYIYIHKYILMIKLLKQLQKRQQNNKCKGAEMDTQAGVNINYPVFLFSIRMMLSELFVPLLINYLINY